MDIKHFGISAMAGHESIHSVHNFYIRRLVSTGRKGMMPPARTSVHCFFFLQKGSVEIAVAERRIKVSGSSCLIVPMGQVFSVLDFSSDAEGYMGGFHNDFLTASGQRPLIYGWLSNPIELSGKRLSYVESIFNRIYDEWTGQDINLPLITIYLQALLAELNCCKTEISQGSSNGADTITDNFLQILSGPIDEKVNVNSIAGRMNITPGHLSKCVRQTTGKSPIKWIEEKIMTEAKMMLCQTDMPIGEIAVKVGITDASYFSRVFRKCEGMTPNDFREMIKKS